MAKLVILTFSEGDFLKGFKIQMEIGNENEPPSKVHGNLPGNPTIPENYDCWHEQYLDLDKCSRGRKGHTTSIAPDKIREQCRNAADKFINCLKESLKDSALQDLREKLCQKLGNETEAIRVIIQTDEPQLKKIPWHEWDLFADTYTQAEVALCPTKYDNPSMIETSDKTAIKILAILGNSEGIDVENDCQALEELRLKGAEPKFLVEPKCADISDSLWDQNWDILFFAGHSSSQGEKGRIYINRTESLTIEELKNGLRRAIKHGLQLAIFNSCDGLKLADDLADLNIPQVIVMREPVPDQVAQEFLKFFLKAYSQGESLYLAVRHARERLHEKGLDQEFPGAIWLPVLYQNLTVKPPTWYQLGGGFPVKTWECKQKLQHSEGVNAMAISPDSQTIVSFDGNLKKNKTIIRAWDLQTEEKLYKRIESSKSANLVAISPDGKFMISSSNHHISLRDSNTGELLDSFESQHSDKVNCVAISSNGKVVSCSNDHTVKIWELATKKLLHTFEAHSDEVKSVAISNQILTSVSTEEIKIWDISSSDDEIRLSVRQCRTFDELSLLNHSFVISDDAQMIAGISNDNTVTVRDLYSGKLNCILNIPPEKSDQFVVGKPLGFFTLDAQVVLVTGSMNQGAFWDSKTGILRSVYTLEDVPTTAGLGELSALSVISPDGKIIAVTGGYFGKSIYIFREK
jgi:WD40 repeat protein